MSYPLAWLESLQDPGACTLRLVPEYFTGIPYVGSRADAIDMSQIRQIGAVARSLQPYRWAASHGSCSIDILADAVDPLRLRKGSLWALEFETREGAHPLWRMWLTSARLVHSGGENVYRLSFLDLSAMSARALDGASDLSLFANAGTRQELTSGYTPGGTVSVSSTAAFHARTIGGNPDGLLRLEDSSATGSGPGASDSFFVRWNAKTGTTLSDVGSDQYGTTRHSVISPNGVAVSLGFYEGHPARFVEELYTGESASVSAGRSSADPGWLKLPEYLYDRSDSEVQLIRSGGAPPTSDAHDWAFWTDVPMTMDVAVTWLGTGGWFITCRGGRVTARTLSLLPVYWDPDVDPHVTHTIDLSELKARDNGAAELSSDLFGDARWPIEYISVEVSTQASTGISPVSSAARPRAFPIQQVYGVDLDNTERFVEETSVSIPYGIAESRGGTTGILAIRRTYRHRYQIAAIDLPSGGPALYAETSNNLKIARALSQFVVHAPQIVRMRVMGPHPEYTLGDVVRFGDDFAIIPTADGENLAGRVGMIAGVNMDLAAWANTVEVWVPPLHPVDRSATSGIADPQE